MMRCSRSRTMSTLLVLVGPSPPDTSAPHDRQNLLLPGIGVWQRKHSTTGLVIGASCPDGSVQPGGRVAGWPPRDARGAWSRPGARPERARGVLAGARDCRDRSRENKIGRAHV